MIKHSTLTLHCLRLSLLLPLRRTIVYNRNHRLPSQTLNTVAEPVREVQQLLQA